MENEVKVGIALRELDSSMFDDEFAEGKPEVITVYSRPSCVKCKMLKELLKDKNINFNEVTSIEEMQAKGLMSVPALEVNDCLMLYEDAMAWANEQ